METYLGIERADVIKVKHMLDKYALTMDELIGCFDIKKFRQREIERLEIQLNDLKHEQAEQQ